ncbi:unnamed protein product [Rotaria magnacalcarata]|uniref:Microbial-type PARG catalytic domain-containing protein n=1 Tax=Rotaria magnacalcarata TaxID=392030 RepID=A0A815Z6B9_9BILA|nr:unnamed protein product [Rotaria magnacalcarata]CAF2031038.1 unnamed protein product [Rotaria magnacalcarata]
MFTSRQHQHLRHRSSSLPPRRGDHYHRSYLNEITARNSYNTDGMRERPDIEPFLGHPSHPIFSSREWNAHVWLREFRNARGNEVRCRWLRVLAQLNTIGVVRNKNYVTDTGNHVLLKHTCPKTVLYGLHTILRVNSTSIYPVYPQTAVRVVSGDCLHVYEDLAAQGYHPLLLNMANAYMPGGGYRRGAGAQEENIFRRSDYFFSLDKALDSEKRCEYFKINAQGDHRRITHNNSLYPMSTFGALYTRGITVFRDSENKGYAFLNEPVYDVCAVAMAAYPNPPLKGNHLPLEYAANTRKKIENIFSIAHHQKHNCLVLSAFGCGAFKNPPEDMAALFKTVILQYAGFFHMIVFAITDGHSTNGLHNPQENFVSFHNLLHNYNAVAPNLHQVGMSLGSHRIREIHPNGRMMLSDFAIAQYPCKYGGICNKTHDQGHTRCFSHPSLCSHDSRNCNTDIIHNRSFVHRSFQVHGHM